MLIKKNNVILFFGMLLGVLLSIGSSVFAGRESAKTSTSTATKGQQKTISLPYKELRRFTEVFGRIKRDYVEPVTDKKLLEDAIKGMLSGLDPHSAYLDAEQYKGLREGTTGQFGGLGIEVTMENGFVKVISPIDDTPAKRAGMKAGDLIVRLDKKPVKGMSLADAVKLMRGKPGDDILLTVIREGADAPLKVTITRAIINVKSVKNKILEKDFGYIRISSFQSRTGQGLIEAVNELKKENQNDLKGLVLDLRNNPGGVLNAAVEVSDAFLEKGLIVYTEGRIKNSEMQFNATPGDIVDGVPIVVLINAGSASASEIVAGALQDHHRAILMGEKSFGKGSVQTILPTGNDAAVKLTTARYYTPSGRSIQAEGIEPDVVLERVKLEALATSFKPVKEADLSHHLENGDSNKEGEEDKNDEDKNDEDKNDEDKNDEDKNDEDKAESSDLRDYPLHQALTLLKGLSILNK
ncbi:MAG: PDZ domain-containing protein [Methylococcales symbiont of Iophon sp. n. MRB-2018]|nr:MAG: PDZ domain-containing protein [Methylococcales symbiont of Iophon sp. n. MRB-2018]KAF3980134.1 MAG: PDZ domain-containing protein [Methylococcales symbiont of Iophon sp. n. MRB-2018]